MRLVTAAKASPHAIFYSLNAALESIQTTRLVTNKKKKKNINAGIRIPHGSEETMKFHDVRNFVSSNRSQSIFYTA